MSDEGMGRPTEAHEEFHDSVQGYMYEVPVPYGYQAMELDFTLNIPLNVRDIVREYLSHIDQESAVRVLTAAVILYWSTSEDTGMWECLYKARELDRETRP